MKHCLFFLVPLILLLLCTSGFAQFPPCTFQTDISGLAVWSDGGTPTIQPGLPFDINFYVTQTGITTTRCTWSSPFAVTGTGVASVTWAGTAEPTTWDTWIPPAFWNLWDVVRFTYAESWDGNLPDRLNFTGIGHLYGLGNVTHLKFLNIKASSIALTDINIPGQICVEQGDMVDNNYDWLFDDIVPTFPTTCFPVKPCASLPGDANASGTFNALDITYLINFLHKSGPAPKPDPIASGDADCNCTVNILDVTYLINYLYKHRPAPCGCGAWQSTCP